MRFRNTLSAAATVILSLSAVASHAGAIHDADLFTSFNLGPADDKSSGKVSLGFTALTNKTSYSDIFVNNNGNVTFGRALREFTPQVLSAGSELIIAPFWADVDTVGSGSGLTTYGTGVIDGRNVFGVNWINVGYFNKKTINTNSFQLILTDRSDIKSGDIDIQFNYDQVKWDTGDGSEGISAAAGYALGADNLHQLAGSFENGAFLNSGAKALISHSLNSNVLGQYNFRLRDGAVVAAVPEPESYAMIAMGLAVLGFVTRRRHKATAG